MLLAQRLRGVAFGPALLRTVLVETSPAKSTVASHRQFDAAIWVKRTHSFAGNKSKTRELPFDFLHKNTEIPAARKDAEAAAARHDAEVAVGEKNADLPSSGKKRDSKRLGAFWDFDNIRPELWERDCVASYTDPVKQLARILGFRLEPFHAAGNHLAWKHVSSIEEARRETIGDPEFDFEEHISGHDPMLDVLRCGVCGAKFKTDEKLQKHFKIHERERNKIRTWRKQGRTLKAKDSLRLQKYSAAQPSVKGRYSGKHLKRIAREEGVQITATNQTNQAADIALRAKAEKFLREVRRRKAASVAGMQTGPGGRESQQSSGGPSPPQKTDGVVGCLLLMSRDTGFASLLGRAQNMGVLTVVAIEPQVHQGMAGQEEHDALDDLPKKLRVVCDILLHVGEASTDRVRAWAVSAAGHQQLCQLEATAPALEGVQSVTTNEPSKPPSGSGGS